MKKALLLLTIVLWPAMVFAELQTQPVDYRDGSTVLEGYLAVKKGIEGKQPGVLVVPDWMGLKKPYMDIADKLADMGYVAFAADIYGRAYVRQIARKRQQRPRNIKQTENCSDSESLLAWKNSRRTLM